MLDVLSTLNFVWDLIKPVGVHVFEDRLKPKTSSKTAEKRALALYSALRDLEVNIDRFVTSFEQWVALGEQVAPEGEEFNHIMKLSQYSCEVENRAQDIVNGLVTLADALQALDPQLGIYKPGLVGLLDGFGVSEAQLAEQARQVLPNPEDLRSALAQAQENRQLLHAAIEEIRLFIASEFSFKDMF